MKPGFIKMLEGCVTGIVPGVLTLFLLDEQIYRLGS